MSYITAFDDRIIADGAAGLCNVFYAAAYVRVRCYRSREKNASETQEFTSVSWFNHALSSLVKQQALQLKRCLPYALGQHIFVFV